MPLTDEQIRKMMQKEIAAKTILVSNEEIDSIINQYKKDGWEFVNQVSCGNKTKLTFRKVK